MASINRRTTDELLTEHQLRAGMSGVTAYVARSKEYLAAAYTHICATWQHPELEATFTSGTISSGSDSLDISTEDPLVIFKVWLLVDATSAFIKRLRMLNSHALLQRYRAPTTAIQPDYYSRYAETLLFETPTNAAYKVKMFYYKKPTDLDDDGTTSNSVLSREWDEPMLEYSLYLAHKSAWRPDLAAAHLECYKNMVSELPTLPILSGDEAEDEDRPMSKPHGGARG